MNPKTAKNFSVRIRVPDRGVSSLYTPTPDANGITSIAVNGQAVKPAIEKGYAVITRALEGRRQGRRRAADEGAARPRRARRSQDTRNKVALRYGPLIYNIEQVDQDIDKPLSPNSPLTAEWQGDLLGGVMVIKGKFADGSPMMAIPNYARTNRDKELPLEGALPIGADGAVRPAQRPPTSIVWMREG